MSRAPHGLRGNLVTTYLDLSPNLLEGPVKSPLSNYVQKIIPETVFQLLLNNYTITAPSGQQLLYCFTSFWREVLFLALHLLVVFEAVCACPDHFPDPQVGLAYHSISVTTAVQDNV